MKIKKAIIRILVLTTVLSVFFVAITSQLSTLYELSEAERQLHLTIENEERITSELTEELENYNSDSFVEKKARQYLGYVFPDELVFIRD